MNVSGQATNPHPRVRLDPQGVLEGKALNTMGNPPMNIEPREYYAFRNIPYGQNVGGDFRFTVRQSPSL